MFEKIWVSKSIISSTKNYEITDTLKKFVENLELKGLISLKFVLTRATAIFLKEKCRSD